MKDTKRKVVKQVQRMESDLQRIITRVLKADVPGSGIEPEFVQGLVRGIVYGLPAVLMLYVLRRTCFRRKPKVKPAPSSSKSRSKASTSKGGPRSKR